MFEILTIAYLIAIGIILVFLRGAAILRDARDRRRIRRPTINHDYRGKLK